MSTHKVLYNNCHGGFRLSQKALEMLYAKGYPSIVKRENGTYTGGHYFVRHDPVVVDVVEQLGAEASGKYSKIKICEIQGNRYRIEEYDGLEGIITPENERYYIIE